MSPSCIFDLTPSEKLQLVEFLWDDLSATPENLPVYDWQIEELDQRKSNLIRPPGTPKLAGEPNVPKINEQSR